MFYAKLNPNQGKWFRLSYRKNRPWIKIPAGLFTNQSKYLVDNYIGKIFLQNIHYFYHLIIIRGLDTR